MARAAYRNTGLPVAQRVGDLLMRMTVEEKVAQLSGVPTGHLMTRGKFSEAKARKLLPKGTGQITRVGAAPEGLAPRDAARFIADVQRFLAKKTRLGIPVIVHEECLSGFTAMSATTFPQAIALSSTWDPNLLSEIAAVIGKQVRSIGATQGLSPVLDVARDPRWGRTEETMGEDPYLVARMGTAYVQGLQGEDPTTAILATPKHFAAHGFPEGGRNCSPVHVAERELREVFLFPFEAAVKVGKARSLMNAYHTLDGIPCARDRRLLTGILREEWGFQGFVFSDYGSIKMLETFHKVARDAKEAGVMALEAGIDVEMPSAECYGENLLAALREGLVSEATIDTAVRRILAAKFELGLFEKPHADLARVPRRLDNPRARTLALRAAREGIVLLKNNRVLPLGGRAGMIAVIGPNADSPRQLYGDYAYTTHVPAPNDLKGVTVLAGLRKRAAKARVTVRHAKGCDLSGADRNAFPEAIEAAKASDVVIAVMGEKAGYDHDNISGEACDRSDIGLPGVQEELVLELARTGKPVVLLLLNGRALGLGRLAQECAAIVEAWYPGEEGGTAVADILFGDVSPSGKLPISLPSHVGEVPLYYNRLPSAHQDFVGHYVNTSTLPVSKSPARALFPFGHGLSYAKFRYSRLSIAPGKAGAVNRVKIRFRVENTGKVRSDEVAQLYIRDEVASVSRPVKELKGFARVSLAPGEKKTVSFTVGLDQLAFYDDRMRLVVEPGSFEVMVGSSSEDIRLRGTFEVVGPVKVVMTERTFFSSVEVQ